MNVTKAPGSIICFGESGWDIVSGTQFPGGISISLPYHLHKLGLTAVPVTRIGIDEAGKNLIRFMEKQSISTEHFQLDYELMTGKTIKSEYNGLLQHELPRVVAWDKIIWDSAFDQLFTSDSCLIYGSVAARDALSRNTLSQMQEAVPRRIVLLGLKPPYFTKKTVEQCIKGAYLLQLTPDELELVTGWFADYPTIEDRVTALQDKFQLPYLVITEGKAGAMLNADGMMYYHRGFPRETTEETGSADAFLAGLISGLIQQDRTEEALQYACALGHLVSNLAGACPEYEVEAIDQLIAKNNIIS